LMSASEDLTQPGEAPPPPPVEASPSVDVPMAEARAPPPPPVRDGLDIVNMLLPRLQRREIIACHQTCRLLRDTVRKADFRPWTKRLALAEQRSRRACNADKRLLEEFRNAYTGGAAMTADHMARHAVPLATLNEVCSALRDFGPERPPAGWWTTALPRALAATPETAVWGRPALDAARVDDLRDAHEVAGRLCETVIGESPTAQPWVAAAAFVLNAGDGWRGPMYALAAMEHALGSSTATYTIREFASRLLVALVDGHWPRLKLLNDVPGRGTLFVDVLKALHNLGFAPALRVNRDPPGTLTAEQEAYAGADLTPRTTGHECLIVEAYAGTGKSHSTLQFAARRQAAGERVLVLYFNKSMYQEMVVKLAAASPGTVCSTMDALVLREFLRQAPELVEPGESSMFHDVSAGGPAYSALALRRALRISEDDRYKGQLAKHTRQVLNAFVYSADTDVPDIEDRRFYRIRQWWQERQPQMPPFQNHARALWRKVISRAPADAHMKLSFAEVAKCFQLRALVAQNNNSDIDWMRRGLPAGTVLDRITPFAGTQDYSYVVIDEAQDLNPTHYELFVTGPRRARQRIAHALVGDPFQSLYAWRGAKNALRDAKATLQHTLIRLTKSFRFGEEVADLATAVLQRCGDPATARLVGAGPPGRIHHRNDIDCHDWRTGTPITVLGRSNKNVLLAAHEYVAEYLRHGDRTPFIFVRGARGGADMNKTLRLVERLVELRNSGDVGTFGEDTATYLEFVRLWREDALDNIELERGIQMVEARPDATAVIRGIRDMSVETPEEARVVLSTVHQMKGLESGAIRILDDVVKGVADDLGRPQRLPDATLCLVYTALSRAIGDLYLPKALSAVWLRQNPPRAVLRCVPPLERRTWCGLCPRTLVYPADEEAEDAFGAVPAYDTGATLRVCEFCRGFCDPAVPLQVPTYEHFRAGWDLRAIAGDSDDGGDAT